MEKDKTLVVCSDPGGANCLALKFKKINFIATLEGSAKNFF